MSLGKTSGRRRDAVNRSQETCLINNHRYTYERWEGDCRKSQTTYPGQCGSSSLRVMRRLLFSVRLETAPRAEDGPAGQNPAQKARAKANARTASRGQTVVFSLHSYSFTEEMSVMKMHRRFSRKALRRLGAGAPICIRSLFSRK